MEASPRDWKAELRTLVLRWAAAVALSLLVDWGLYVARVTAGFDPMRSRLRGPGSTTGYLGLALGLTLFFGPWALWSIRRARYLIKNGVEARGTVLKVGDIVSGGKLSARVGYRANGSDYVTKSHIAAAIAVVGRSVSVIYDPARPQRCEVVA